jgi:hypothetical protein
MNASQREEIRLASNARASKRADRLGKLFAEKYGIYTHGRKRSLKSRTSKEKRMMRRILRSMIAQYKGVQDVSNVTRILASCLKKVGQ